MQRLPRSIFVFRLLVRELIVIVTPLLTGIVFDPAEISIILFLVFFEDNSVFASCQSIKRLALLAFPIQTKILFEKLI